MNPHAWIQGEHDRLLERVIDWANVNSGSGNEAGLNRLAEQIQREFQDLDPDDSTLRFLSEDAIPRGPLIRLTKRPNAKKRVLFFGHLDTVYSLEHPLQRTQLLPDGRLNGPGVCDMKGGLAILLCGLTAFENSAHEKRFGWTILINSDEELGSPLSTPFFEDAARGHEVAFGFEPALRDGSIASSRRGTGNFTLRFHGKAAHSGRNPYDGINALIPLAHFILECQKLNGRRDSIFINPAIVTGGTAPNVVPDFASCQVNVRTTSSNDETWILEELHRFVAEIPKDGGYHGEISGGFTAAPKMLNPQIENLIELVRKAGQKIGIDIHARPTGGTCDGNRLASFGLPNLDNLGARGDHIHSQAEFIYPESLVERARVLYELLLGLNERLTQ
ncbi:MAG: glutamate carboxypeptidase [Verrucomicrobiota bacterium]